MSDHFKEEPKKWDWHLQSHDGMVLVTNDKDHFEADLAVPIFNPDEIDVKVLNDELFVNCNQEEDEEGRHRRQVRRAYHLPHDVDVNSLKTKMLPNGRLHITAKKQ